MKKSSFVVILLILLTDYLSYGVTSLAANPKAVGEYQLPAPQQTTISNGGLAQPVPTQQDASTNSEQGKDSQPNSTLGCREFPDVPAGSVYYEAVQYLVCKDYARGNTDGLFHPERYVNRAEFATMLVSAFAWKKSLAPVSGQTFSDVPRNNDFFNQIETAHAYGVINGYSDGTFRPWSPVRRSEELVMLVGAAGFPSYSPPTPDFNDVPLGYWAYVQIETAYHEGVARGNNGYIRPDDYAIRGDTANFIFRSSNGPSNGMLGHCCRTSPEVGQYEGSNNMIYDYANPSGPVQPIIPGGKMIGTYDYPYSNVKATINDIVWEPTAVNWLKAHEDEGYPNKRSTSVVLHAFTAGTTACTPGSWVSIYSNLPNQADPYIKSACNTFDRAEVRVYMNTMQNLTSNIRYSVHAEYAVDSSIGPGDSGSINVDNYWFQRTGDQVYHRDSMNQMCYSGANLIPTWCR